MAAAGSSLMESLERAIRHDAPTLISIDGHGSISIYPRQGSYTTDIRDWDSLPMPEPSGIRAAAVVWGSPPPDSMPVCELRWLAAYHHACRSIETQPVPRGLVKLLHWPDLSAVPESMAPAVVRICALLWRKPTASTLIARVIECPPSQVDALLSVLQAFGHIDMACQFGDRVEEIPPAEAAQVARPVASAPANVIGKLWQRLLGH